MADFTWDQDGTEWQTKFNDAIDKGQPFVAVQITATTTVYVNANAVRLTGS